MLTRKSTIATTVALLITTMLATACSQSAADTVSDQAEDQPATQSKAQIDIALPTPVPLTESETTAMLTLNDPAMSASEPASATSAPASASTNTEANTQKLSSAGQQGPATGMNQQADQADQAVPKPTPEQVRTRKYGTNPFYDTDEDNLSTFSLDADTASHDATLDAIRNGHPIRKDAVRVEDFLNAIPQGYDQQDQISLHLDVTPSPYNVDDYHIVRVGVAPPSGTSERPPTSVIFVIDTSGSMSGAPIATSARAASAIGDQLDEDDRVSVVGYGSGTTTTHLAPQPFESSTQLRDLFESLHADGSTPLAQAVLDAYQLVELEAQRDDVQHIAMVLISDGFGNVGAWEFEQIQATIQQPVTRSVTLNTIAITEQHFDDIMMEALANNGNGFYSYLPTGADLEEFTEQTAPFIIRSGPRDARIQVEFNPAVVRKYRLIGYENRRVADEDFRDDSLDFGEPGFQREATALYEVRLHEDEPTSDDVAVLTARLRWRNADEDTHREIEATLTHAQLAPSDEAKNPYLARAIAIAEFAEILRGSTWADCRHTSDALANLRQSARTTDDEPEILTVLDLLPSDWNQHCNRP